MSSKVSKILSIVIALVMIAGLAACGSTSTDKGQPAGGAETAGTQKEEAKKEEGKTTTIKFWTLWTETVQDANAKAFWRVLGNYKNDLPDIVIEHDATENEAYKTKIKTAIAANEGPDVFFTWGAGFLKPFVEAGKVLPLDDYLKDGTADRINPGTTTYFTFDGKTYALPAYQWVAVLYCNKELFEKNNVKIPDTYEELLDAVKAFRAKGISPIAVGEKDRWPGMFWQNALALRIGGAQLCQDALAKKASFDQPAFVESAAKLKELVEAKAFIDGNMGLTNPEADATFMEGQVPMYYTGNWYAGNIMDESSKVKDKVICKKFPAVSGGNGTMDEFLGGSIDGLCVYADSKEKDTAVRVVKYFAEALAKELNATGAGLPTWKVEDAPGAQINPITQQIKELIKDAKGYVLAWDTFLEGADAETHKNLVAEIFGGAITPEDFAKEMQKLNEKK